MSDPNRPPSSPGQPPSAFPPAESPPQTLPYSSMGPPTPEEKTWGMFAHLSALAGLVVPLGNLIGPLIVWLMKKDQMPFVNDQGKESLNFQIMISILLLISIALACFVIGFFLIPIVLVFQIIFEIVGGVQAQKGIAYRYPINFRIIR
jgi:uncharacterized Tic20 family protein